MEKRTHIIALVSIVVAAIGVFTLPYTYETDLGFVSLLFCALGALSAGWHIAKLILGDL